MLKKTRQMKLRLICLSFLIIVIWADRYSFAEKKKTEIIIGTHLPLSGAMAMLAVENKWAYELAAADINKQGGIYVREYGRKLPVRLMIMDDESDPKKASVIVEQLITRTNVDMLLGGHSGSFGGIPGMIMAEKHNKYYHAGTTVWIPDFLKHNFKMSTIFSMDMAQAGSTPFIVWNSLPEEQHPKKPAFFIEDTMDGKLLGELMASLAAEKYGYKEVLKESMGIGLKDFSKQIIRAKSSGVDAIFLFANTEESVILVRQMKRLDFNVKLIHGIKGTWAVDFYKALGKDAEYVLCDGFWSMDFPFPGAKELGERYYKEYGKYSVSVGMYYALCQILWQAIGMAGSLDPVKVLQAVKNGEFDTVMGKVDYDEKGVSVFPLAAFQWYNGNQEVLFPFEYSKFKVKTAPQWDKR